LHATARAGMVGVYVMCACLPPRRRRNEIENASPVRAATRLRVV
jgi:hypothetical protein